MKQVNIDETLWEKLSKFSKIIKWDPNKFTEYILNMMIDFYCQAIKPFQSDISEMIFHEFLENPLLNELKTISE